MRDQDTGRVPALDLRAGAPAPARRCPDRGCRWVRPPAAASAGAPARARWRHAAIRRRTIRAAGSPRASRPTAASIAVTRASCSGTRFEDQRQRDVLLQAQIGQDVKRLEHEAHAGPVGLQRPWDLLFRYVERIVVPRQVSAAVADVRNTQSEVREEFAVQGEVPLVALAFLMLRSTAVIAPGFGLMTPEPGKGLASVIDGTVPAAGSKDSASRKGGLLNPRCRGPMNTGRKL